MSFRITFLGTGGGRHTTMYQVRSTGGMLIEHDGRFLHVDPGPGALTQMHRIRYDLTRTESLIVSHCHPDHYSDAESVLEGMSRGGWVKHGHLYGSETVINGNGRLGPCISDYHKGIVEDVTVFTPGDVLDVDGLKVDICRAIHSDPTVLLLPVTTPTGNRIKYHLCTDDAITFVDRVKPELAIFIHLGVVIIRRGPDAEAASVEDATGVRTIAAHDLMTLDVGEELTVSDAETFDGEWIPDSSP